MSSTGVPESSEERPQATDPRVPQLGPVVTGLLSVLLVGSLFAVPLFGIVIAPLGMIPVARSIAMGVPGVRCWGWVMVLLVVLSAGWMGRLPLMLMVAYGLVVVIPAISLELWRRASWSEGRWVALTTGAASILMLVVVAVGVWPDAPVVGTATWLRSAAESAGELSTSMGMSAGEMRLALDAAERMLSWILPALPVAYLVAILFWIRPRLPVLGFPMPVGPFEEFRNDEWLPVGFVAAGLGTLVFSGTPRWVCLNILLAVLTLYFVHGLAIIRAHLARWIGRGWFVRWGVALLCVQFPLPMVVAALGVADSFVQLRPRVDDDGRQHESDSE
jgi:hypothetical protein